MGKSPSRVGVGDFCRGKRAELTRFLGFTSERILFMDSPSDLPSKSIYNIEHLETIETCFSGLVLEQQKCRKKKKAVRRFEKEKKSSHCFY